MTERYPTSIRIIHWLMAILIFGMIGLGWFMAELDKTVTYRGALYDLHKSIGVTILLLFFVRVGLRLTSHIPPLPRTLPAMVRKLAHAGHFGIYLFIFLVPLSGYAMSNMFGYPVHLFGVKMPMLFAENKELAKIVHDRHGQLAYVMLALLVLHAAAALKHRFFDKEHPENDVLKRML